MATSPPGQSAWYLQSVDRVSRTLSGGQGADAMIEATIAEILEIFQADRAWLDYPCDPDAPSFSVPVEVTRPEYPGIGSARAAEPMSPGMSAVMRAALSSRGALTGPGADAETREFPSAREYGVRSRMWMALRPRDGLPWLIGVHQCSREREWTDEERALFEEIGQQVSKRLSTWLLVERLQRDIDRRNAAEAALRGSEERFRDYAATAADWLWETDADERFTHFAGHFDALATSAKDDVLGRTRKAVHAGNPRMSDADRAPLRELIDARRPFDGFRIRTTNAGDGSPRDLTISGRPRFADDGSFLGYRGTGRDVTREVAAEERERRLQAALRQGQKMQAIGRLAGGIAHDFNNVLASVIGFAELLRGLPPSDPHGKRDGYVQEILDASERARRLIEQLLTFSRGGTSRARPAAIVPAVREAVRMLRPLLAREVELDVVTGSGAPHALIDEVQLSQVVLNLGLNARDALGEAGRIGVSLDAEYLASGGCASCHAEIDGSWIALSIRDFGRGMPPALVERVFEPFFSTKPPRRGNGMGLPVVHGIVHEAGGHLQIESVPGEGTLVRVLLQVAAASDGAHPILPECATRAQGSQVLVVDDEGGIVRFVSEVLELEGYRPRAFTDPQAARDLLHHDPFAFDALICDQTMPGLTGSELMREALALRADLPVIMITGFSDALDSKRALAMGAYAFLSKPLEPSVLLSTLARAFATTRPRKGIER